MLKATPRVRINAPTVTIPHGRGFYQLEEEALYFPIEYPGQTTKFYSYLDSSDISLQSDRSARLIFIEVTIPRRRWKVRRNFIPPETSEIFDLRFLDFREMVKSPSIFCDRTRQNMLIRFSRGAAERNICLAENLIAQISSDGRMLTAWIFNIADDLAGKGIATWRKALRAEYLNTESAPVK
jgi:hypothetical protein